MLKVKLSSKRQTTFPKQVCESLGLRPGDSLLLESRKEEDGEVWLLRTEQAPSRPWLGSLRAYAAGKNHDMESVRSSVARHRSATETTETTKTTKTTET